MKSQLNHTHNVFAAAATLCLVLHQITEHWKYTWLVSVSVCVCIIAVHWNSPGNLFVIAVLHAHGSTIPFSDCFHKVGEHFWGRKDMKFLRDSDRSTKPSFPSAHSKHSKSFCYLQKNLNLNRFQNGARYLWTLEAGWTQAMLHLLFQYISSLDIGWIFISKLAQRHSLGASVKYSILKQRNNK